MKYYDYIQEAVSHIQGQLVHKPEVAIILGTGLSSLNDIMTNRITLAYDSIPHLGKSTVKSHINELNIGQIEGKTVLTFSGRLHAYEGYSMKEITFPVRIAQGLGIKTLLMSNAAGGLNRNYVAGDIICLKDHINFMHANPLTGFNDHRLGIRFPDMSKAYDPTLRLLCKSICKKHNLPYKEGIYLGLQGPSLETDAEYKAFKMMGADLIGMSTIPEVIVATHANIKTLVLSIVTNVFKENATEKTTIDSVIATAKKAEPNCVLLISKIIREL